MIIPLEFHDKDPARVTSTHPRGSTIYDDLLLASDRPWHPGDLQDGLN